MLTRRGAPPALLALSPLPSAEPVIALEGVSRRYGALTALHNLTLTIAPGEFFSLVGTSGCGKTTTLRLIAFFTSVVLALAAAAVAIVLGGLLALGLSRARGREMGAIEGLVALPLTNPEIVLAASLLYLFAGLNLPRGPLPCSWPTVCFA
ncbi:MAG: ATP-binding cassette domain-containing protein [Cyanobium sp.]